MNILEYADVINQQIIITYYPNQDGRFSAKFDSGEIKQGGCLASEHGNDESPFAAINNYVDLIRDKVIVFNAMNKKYRQEFVIPKYIDKLPVNYKESVATKTNKQSTPCCDTPNILPYGLNEVMCYNCNTVVKK